MCSPLSINPATTLRSNPRGDYPDSTTAVMPVNPPNAVSSCYREERAGGNNKGGHHCPPSVTIEEACCYRLASLRLTR